MKEGRKRYYYHYCGYSEYNAGKNMVVIIAMGEMMMMMMLRMMMMMNIITIFTSFPNK